MVLMNTIEIPHPSDLCFVLQCGLGVSILSFLFISLVLGFIAWNKLEMKYIKFCTKEILIIWALYIAWSMVNWCNLSLRDETLWHTKNSLLIHFGNNGYRTMYWKSQPISMKLLGYEAQILRESGFRVYISCKEIFKQNSFLLQLPIRKYNVWKN